MGTSMTAFIEYDEEYADQLRCIRYSHPHANRELPPPFAPGNSISLTHEEGLYTGGKDYPFFGAISGVRNLTGIEPLYPPRGLPDNLSWPIERAVKIRVFEGLSGVGWLTLAEINAALDHQSISLDHLENTTLAMLDIMGVLEKRFGPSRVRLIFGFD